MAGDWIKLQRATPDKPEVWEMASILRIDADSVLGKLIRVWLWFDEQTEDGNARSVTDATLTSRIDDITHIDGFAEAMRSVGWLNGTKIPHFDRHNGESAKKRALGAERLKRFRNAHGVTNAVGVSKALPDKSRVDKSRVERELEPEKHFSTPLSPRAKPTTNRITCGLCQEPAVTSDALGRWWCSEHYRGD